ncbi:MULTISPECIES: hypothetical protein [Bacillus cereus group]|uniref:hypothetical protein n=1 Tax=Bacillus TaxID=1386 RepID=UPI000B72F122|nr:MULTISPECIES: hypothetical protein [Bacillus cereus group]MEB9631708.1 hypothetical protein [Bacillus anthracis]OUB01724.1 hypothetical protein BK714_03575 [Bacillus thuringiensis serovar oswaldocruzi]
MKNEQNYCGCDKRPFENENYQDFHAGYYTGGILNFLRRLSPGTCIVLQYDSQPPTSGTFQGFQNGLVILSDFDCFPGLAHLALEKINVLTLGSLPCNPPRDCEFR